MKKFKLIIVLFILVAFIGVSLVFGLNFYVKASQKGKIITSQKATELENVDCVLVLGCKVNGENIPSDMLKDRLDRAVELYYLGASSKIIMSGDHGRKEYDEVNTMKNYALEKDIPSENIFMDHAGFSTYESLYRAKEIFEAKKIIIVTQEYHLFRALYIAQKLGIEAYGVASDYHIYRGSYLNEIRELLARNKDFYKTLLKPEPTYLGEKIPVSGDGNLTNDKS